LCDRDHPVGGVVYVRSVDQLPALSTTTLAVEPQIN